MPPDDNADRDELFRQAWRLRDEKRPAEALSLFERLIGLEPNGYRARDGLGVAFGDLGRRAEAIDQFERAVAVASQNGSLWQNLGVAQLRASRFQESVVSLETALALGHRTEDLFASLAIALFRCARHLDAMPLFERIWASASGDASTRYIGAECALALGDFRRGLAWFESRWDMQPAMAEFMPSGRPWLGNFPIEGKTILVFAEQGMGDSLQFCRYIPLLGRRAKVILAVPSPLGRLMRGLDGVDTILVEGQQAPAFDAWIPMLSLPLAFGTTVETIPAAVPYLHADPNQQSAWHDYVSSLPGRKVGLVWAGAPNRDAPDVDPVDKRRSMTLGHFAPLASVPGVCLISLQKGPAAAQARFAPEGMELHDWTEDIDDFADTAALVEALDLVISVDTSVAHLAGALGKPVWILNRYDQCWRWMIGRAGSPWYPTARIFRQKSPGDWAGVVEAVVEALRAGE